MRSIEKLMAPRLDIKKLLSQKLVWLCSACMVWCMPLMGSLSLQVTFLYKLTGGSCPKSYGTNVARLAGLPDQLVKRASEMAATLELDAQKEATTSTASETPVNEMAIREISKTIKSVALSSQQKDASLLEWKLSL